MVSPKANVTKNSKLVFIAGLCECELNDGQTDRHK